MWILNTILAAFFASLTVIFTKLSVSKLNSTLITGLRTTIVLLLIFLINLFLKIKLNFNDLEIKTIIFLFLSGITTMLLWIFHLKALQLGNVNEVSSIDKSSVVITLAVSCIFFNEKITIIKVLSALMILLGGYIMLDKKKKVQSNKWLYYTILTSICMSLVTIFGKAGIEDVDTMFATLIRTSIAFVLIWGYIYIKKYYKEIKKITKKDIKLIVLSGIATSLSWIFYFLALKDGETSTVFTLEKINVAFTAIISYIFLKEKISKKNIFGITMIVIGNLILLF